MSGSVAKGLPVPKPSTPLYFSNVASKFFAASHFLNALSGPGCVWCDNEPIDFILFPKQSSQVYVP